MHNYILGPVDTDSVSLCKPDMSPFSIEERKSLLDEINSKFPELIKYADDGYFIRCIALKAKNYILYDGEKIKIKGSALKGSTKSEALKELTKKFIEITAYTEDRTEMYAKLQSLYDQYIGEAMNVQDIKRWSARKTLSSTMQESTRTNETRVLEALKGSNYREGDRFWTFFKSDDSVCLAENFDGDYNKTRLLKNIWDTVSIFDTVIPVKDLFVNYSLKKNYKLLDNTDTSIIS